MRTDVFHIRTKNNFYSSNTSITFMKYSLGYMFRPQYATHSTLKPVPTLPRKRQIAVTVWQIPDAVDAVVYAPDDGLNYHPKHVEQFPDINKLCNFASCWIYIETVLGAHPILHISRIRVKETMITRSSGLWQPHILERPPAEICLSWIPEGVEMKCRQRKGNINANF
jgi:hypothetical protein